MDEPSFRTQHTIVNDDYIAIAVNVTATFWNRKWVNVIKARHQLMWRKKKLQSWPCLSQKLTESSQAMVGVL